MAGVRPTRRGSTPRPRAASRAGTPRASARPTRRGGAPKQTGRASAQGGARLRRAPRPAKRELTPDRRGSGAERSQRYLPIRRLIIGTIVVASLALVGLLAVLILSYTPAFTITGVDADATAHMDSDSIVRLAAVDDGATLLNLDENKITNNLRKNPWVGSVEYVREFPDRLRIVVHERNIEAIVVMGTGSVAWCLGADDVWVEPYPIDVPDGLSMSDVALTEAQSLGVLLITDVPASVSPVAGTTATDSVITAISSYRNGFSSTMNAQIVSYSVPSLDSISCTLSSGVEVSLGAPTDIEAKETAVGAILAAHENKVTYINVRVPSSPTYRAISSDDVQAGTGAVGSSA